MRALLRPSVDRDRTGAAVQLHADFFARARAASTCTKDQIFNTVVALALVWLCVTGFIGWYQRRPRGGLAAPPKRELVLPRAVLATGVVLCLVMPLLGASVLAIEAIDRVFGRLLVRPS